LKIVLRKSISHTKAPLAYVIADQLKKSYVYHTIIFL